MVDASNDLNSLDEHCYLHLEENKKGLLIESITKHSAFNINIKNKFCNLGLGIDEKLVNHIPKLTLQASIRDQGFITVPFHY